MKVNSFAIVFLVVVLIMNKTKNFNILLMILYSVITFFGALNHEMWFDETEAWVIARDNTLIELIDVLKSEGHPLLWYIIIKPFALLGLSCNIMPFISWFFNIITVFIILFKSPFNFILKISILFSSGFLYYNTIISRVYCLIPFLLCVIALVYPHRKNHYIFFGVLIALLINTHVCISGLVAMLGIYMLIDIFSDWEKISLEDKITSVISILIAGSGVIFLFITLLGSLKSNYNTMNVEISLLSVVESIFMSFYSIGKDAITGSYDIIIITALSDMIVIFSLIFMIIFLRHYKRAFFMLIFFTIVYNVICGVIWYTTPNRSLIFLFIYVFVYWIALQDKSDENYIDASKYKFDSKFIKNIVDVFAAKDKDAIVSYKKLLTLVLLMTVPMGTVYFVSDILYDFCPESSAAEYIKENYSADNTVIITDIDNMPQMSAYIPEYRLYALSKEDYYTYHDHSAEIDTDYCYDNVVEDLYMYENYIYISAINLKSDKRPLSDIGNIVYSKDSPLYFCQKIKYMELAEISLDELK